MNSDDWSYLDPHDDTYQHDMDMLEIKYAFLATLRRLGLVDVNRIDKITIEDGTWFMKQ